MFKSPTVVIIGAGASAEVGMPVGSGLITAIKTTSDDILSVNTMPLSDELKALVTLIYSEYKSEKEFLGKCKELSAGLRHAFSIDNFLDARKDDPQLVRLGKALISYNIAGSERNSALMRLDHEGRFQNETQINGSWYLRFFQRLHLGHELANLESLFENLTVINFNYDRTLKQYLRYAVAEYYGVPLKQAGSVVDRLRELRPYGTIGELPWASRGGDDPVAFGDAERSLLSSHANINTFMENIGSQRQAEIQKALSEAKKLIFLGFAFHEQNMNLLFNGCQLPNIEQIYATSMGMSAPATSVPQNQFRSLLSRAGRSPNFLGSSCASFFDHYGVELSS